jgi:cobalamin biosynthesis protein CobD/CbiB
MLSGSSARRILASPPAQAGAGILIDLAVGEPPPAMHPVAWFGQVKTLTRCED